MLTPPILAKIMELLPNNRQYIRINKRKLNRGNESLAGELKRSQVGNSDNISSSGCVEDNVQGVKKTIVGENLVLLLEVIGSIQKLHLSIQLTCVGVKQDLHLIHGGIKVDRVHGTSLNVSALVGGKEVGTLSNHGGSGVTCGSIEGEVTGSSVVDINSGSLVTGSNQGLDGAHHTILGVCLDLHGGPVGSDPQFNEGFDGTSIGVDAHLDNFLVGIGELPVLTGGTLDADRAADVGKVPFGGGGGESRLGCTHGGVDGEGIGRGGCGGKEGEGELHG